MQKLYQCLRIAWSVAWGIVAVSLCVLWVRSHWWMDNVEPLTGVRIMSVEGRLRFNELVGVNTIQPQQIGLFGNQSFPSNALMPAGVGMSIPHAVLVLAAAALAIGPSLKWSRRFSLRTLLIATTVVAVVMGFVVWISRAS